MESATTPCACTSPADVVFCSTIICLCERPMAVLLEFHDEGQQVLRQRVPDRRHWDSMLVDATAADDAVRMCLTAALSRNRMVMVIRNATGGAADVMLVQTSRARRRLRARYGAGIDANRTTSRRDTSKGVSVLALRIGHRA